MKVLCFGVAKDIVGGSELKIEGQHAQNVSELKKYLNETYPKFLEYKSYMVAVNPVSYTHLTLPTKRIV